MILLSHETVKLCANWRNLKVKQLICKGIIVKFSYDMVMILFFIRNLYLIDKNLEMFVDKIK